jgi:hypothetical protein
MLQLELADPAVFHRGRTVWECCQVILVLDMADILISYCIWGYSMTRDMPDCRGPPNRQFGLLVAVWTCPNVWSFQYPLALNKYTSDISLTVTQFEHKRLYQPFILTRTFSRTLQYLNNKLITQCIMARHSELRVPSEGRSDRQIDHPTSILKTWIVDGFTSYQICFLFLCFGYWNHFQLWCNDGYNSCNDG